MKLTGWRALCAALVAGALAALAMPPLYWLPLAIVGIVAYVWLWQTAQSVQRDAASGGLGMGRSILPRAFSRPLDHIGPSAA